VVVPIRTRYLGSFTSDPTPTEPGQWWYNETEKRFKFYDGASILVFGRRLAAGTTTTVYDSGGDKEIVVTVSGLTNIEYTIRYKFTTDPAVDSGKPINEVITGNVVGFTLVGLGAGTTLTTEVLATGW
jgi:hypothetical protein